MIPSADAATPALQGTVLDHVAVAVDDIAAARRWWQGMGATPVTGAALDGFATEQLRLSNGGKVELLGRGAGGDDTFIARFLQRFGSGRVHHITLKVPRPLTASVDRLRQAGLDVIDVSTDDPDWHESFLRPSQVGGVIVQVAWASLSDEQFAIRQGQGAPPPPDPTAPALDRVVLGHPDLDEALGVWTTLGAAITGDPDRKRFTARWTGAPIAVEVRQADDAGPLGLVLDGRPACDRTPVCPALLELDS